jgi:pimeloyl-ACP methyl ester carboxylesterase
VARGLADSFRVLEPLQRGSGGDPLTVARHVADLHDLLDAHCQSTRPALVGSSWGAMLALAYGAAHPGRTGPIVLIGCGTFDEASRKKLESIRDERMEESLRQRIAKLQDEFPNPDEALRAMGELLLPLYSYELITTDLEIEKCDARAFHETWEDMLRLQKEGVYPAAFAAIDSPVLMLHGSVDPHPGQMIWASLRPHLPQMEYIEWKRCGHYPWLEKAVRHQFYKILREWLSQRLKCEP